MKFNGKASTPVEYDGDGRGCHSQRLADATPINIKYLEEFVETIFAEGKAKIIWEQFKIRFIAKKCLPLYVALYVHM